MVYFQKGFTYITNSIMWCNTWCSSVYSRTYTGLDYKALPACGPWNFRLFRACVPFVWMMTACHKWSWFADLFVRFVPTFMLDIHFSLYRAVIIISMSYFNPKVICLYLIVEMLSTGNNYKTQHNFAVRYHIESRNNLFWLISALAPTLLQQQVQRTPSHVFF